LKLVVQRAGRALGGASREEARMQLLDPPDEDKVCKRGGQSPGTTSRRRRAYRALSTTKIPLPDHRPGHCRACARFLALTVVVVDGTIKAALAPPCIAARAAAPGRCQSFR